MSFSYTGNPGDNDIDTVRFYCQDTSDVDPLLSDEEIQYLIDKWSENTQSLIYVASVACEVIAGKFAREVSYSADGVTVSGDQLQQKYNDLASSLRDLYKADGVAVGPDAGGIMPGEEFDPDVKPLSFGIGFQDNLRGGQQAYGGRRPEEPPEIVNW